jgi:3-oxoacyl-[acyl-carrier-protein] synthase-3
MQRRFNVDPLSIDLIVVATFRRICFFRRCRLGPGCHRGEKCFRFRYFRRCSGFLFALSNAAQYVENGTCRKVLVIGADTMSSITDYTNRDTCVLFGDAAGAVLLEPTAEKDDSGIIDFIMKMDGAGKDFLYILGGGSLNPATAETVARKMHYIYQEGKTVFKFAVKGMADITVELLERNGLSERTSGLYYSSGQ